MNDIRALWDWYYNRPLLRALVCAVSALVCVLYVVDGVYVELAFFLTVLNLVSCALAYAIHVKRSRAVAQAGKVE